MFDIDLAFVSIMEPPNTEMYSKALKKRRAQNITAIQSTLIDGFIANTAQNPWIINTPLLSLFPRGYKFPIVRSSAFHGACNGINHAFLNFSPLYSTSLFYGAKKHLKAWANQVTDKDKVIIAYALTRYTLQIMNYVKSINPKIKTAIIVPDIPELTFRDTKNPLKRIKNIISVKCILKTRKKHAKNVDGWILFSEKMQEKIPEIKNSMVFEGVATDLFSDITKVRDNLNKEILYAGGLNENYGVKLLIDAFSLLKGDDWRLILAGRGPLENYIKQKVKNDPRIIYKGEVLRSDLLVLEKNADCLVNPRTNSGVFTRYSFPSKNMEYLSSGTPMVGFKLDGIPDEYDAYINYFSDETPDSLAQIIEMVCQSNAALKTAESARDFVLQQKNQYCWTKKMIEFMLSL